MKEAGVGYKKNSKNSTRQRKSKNWKNPKFKIEEALPQLKNNEAPRPDGILAEKSKESKEEILLLLGNIFNHGGPHKTEIPEEWKEGTSTIV